MGEAGFTPGPWEHRQLSRDDMVIADQIVADEGKVIVWDVANERNARLIAAAPAGYEFAEAHDAYMLDAGYSGPDDAALHPKAAENWRRCRAFLALARNAPVSDQGEGE